MPDAESDKLSMLPVALRDEAALRLARLEESGLLPDARLDPEDFLKVISCSHFFARVMLQQPGLLASDFIAQLQDPELPAVPDIEGLADFAAVQSALRRFRNAQMARIAWRDITGAASLEQTLADTSRLADSLIESALRWLQDDMRKQHGDARDAGGNRVGFVVLGMGKLGGRELNFSSDIDLIFTYASPGESDGDRPLSNEQYFARLGQRLIRALDDVTDDGFVFRVDMRLRPFGDGGPLVQSFDGMEAYYQQHGREWERYAFIKARPVAGDIAAGEALLEQLRPFVYRRYLDFGVFEALREMKASIDRDVRKKDRRHHVKLGPGGIREAEFIVQLFQLVRGGREPALRTRSFIEALHAAVELECLAASDGELLESAYRFLRNLENRLQMMDDRQTHDVPDDDCALQLVAWSMGFDDSAKFVDAWNGHREQVARIFEQAFLGPAEQRDETHALDAVWESIDTSDELLQEYGFSDIEALRQAMHTVRWKMKKQPLNAQAPRRIRTLMPRLLEAAAKQPYPDITASRMLDLVDAVLGRTTYLALLAEHPEALARLAKLFSASQHIAGLVARHPVLLDELLDPRLFEQRPSEEELDKDLAAALERTDRSDLEAMMDVLREYQQVSQMRIAAADISGTLPLMRVSDLLTHLAERVIQSTLELALQHMHERHGRPVFERDGKAQESKFLVIAYGKLGGLELGYGSDLDLVFMHDSPIDGAMTDGVRSIENSVFFLRLTQRLIHLLSTPTTAGTLYDVDTRLRPSGKGGLLVTSLDAFRRYQQEQAWTWEQQALLRARPVAGDADLATAFCDIRRERICQPRDPYALRQEVADMRERMRRENSTPDGEFDLKGGVGGITDIEFLTQYWVLREAAAMPELLDVPDTIRFLEMLAASDRVPKDQVAILIDAYRALRAEVHACALQGLPARIPADDMQEIRRQVASVWTAEFGVEAGDSGELH